MSWRTRHLAVRAAALRDYALAGELQIMYAPSGEQRADGLTKQLGLPDLVALSRTMLRLKEEECVTQTRCGITSSGNPPAVCEQRSPDKGC